MFCSEQQSSPSKTERGRTHSRGEGGVGFPGVSGKAEDLHLVPLEQLHGLLQLQVPQTTECVRTGGQQLEREREREREGGGGGGGRGERERKREALQLSLHKIPSTRHHIM